MNRIKDKRGNRQRGMIYQPGDVNVLKMHPQETLDHWLTKAILFRLLRKKGHDVITEFEITGMGVSVRELPFKFNPDIYHASSNILLSSALIVI